MAARSSHRTARHKPDQSAALLPSDKKELFRALLYRDRRHSRPDQCRRSILSKVTGDSFHQSLETRRMTWPHIQRCPRACRSEEQTSELQSLMRISYAVFCLIKKTKKIQTN